MKKGFSLMEILVVIFIALVVGAGVYFAYTQLLREAVIKSLVAKNEMDVNALLYQLRKDILSVGFGIDRSLLVLKDSQGTPDDGVINCNNLSGFAYTNSVVARCRANDRQEELYYLSLTARQFGHTGCWWGVDGSGKLIRNSANYKLRTCPDNINSDIGRCVVMNLTKNLLQVGPCPNFSSGQNTSLANSLIFFVCTDTGFQQCAYINNSNYHRYFAVRYYTNTSNLRECAPQTLDILKVAYDDHGDSVPQPVASCVGAFRVRYFDGASYRENITDIRTLRAIRLCLLVQVGGRTSVNIDVPTFSANCGGSFTPPTQDWRWYRWKVVEEDILLENLR